MSIPTRIIIAVLLVVGTVVWIRCAAIQKIETALGIGTTTTTTTLPVTQ